MNLVEELAKQCAKNNGYLLEEIVKAPLNVYFEDFLDDSKTLLPIFAEFIKGIENPYEKVLKPIYRGQPYKPLNTDYFTFEAAREIILSELE